MLFFRFQGTPNIERKSWFIDVVQLYNDLAITDSPDHNLMYKEYEYTFSLRTNIDPKELYCKVLNAISYDEVFAIAHKYKMNGVFAYDAETIMEFNNLNNINELLDFIIQRQKMFTGEKNNKRRMVQNDKYLIIFDGDLIEDFSYHGCLVKMKRIRKRVLNNTAEED